jgi:micrococcal nuclease
MAAVLAVGVAVSGGAFAARAAAPIEGRVTHVSDGDSLWVRPGTAGAPIEVRLVDIDAPELCQPWGPESKAALQALVAGKAVTLHTVGRDDYGRTLAHLSVDGQDVNAQLVQDGHAWSARGRNDHGPLLKEERSAKALGRGLHAQRGAVMPRDFRRSHGPCVAGDAATAPAPAAAPAPAVPGPATAPAAPGAARCDGRIHCSQMTSCAEATWFLQHCPGVKMDGNGDGVPCEAQWCRR